MKRFVQILIACVTLIGLIVCFSVQSFAAFPSAIYPAPALGEILTSNPVLNNSTSINWYRNNILARDVYGDFTFSLPAWYFSSNRLDPVIVSTHAGILSVNQPTSGNGTNIMSAYNDQHSSTGSLLQVTLRPPTAISTPCIAYQIVDFNAFSSGQGTMSFTRSQIFRTFMYPRISNVVTNMYITFCTSTGVVDSTYEFNQSGMTGSGTYIGKTLGSPIRFMVIAYEFSNMPLQDYVFSYPDRYSLSYDPTPREVQQEATTAIINAISTAVNSISTTVTTVVNNSATTISNAVNNSATTISNAVYTVTNAVTEGFSNVLNPPGLSIPPVAGTDDLSESGHRFGDGINNLFDLLGFRGEDSFISLSGLMTSDSFGQFQSSFAWLGQFWTSIVGVDVGIQLTWIFGMLVGFVSFVLGRRFV